MSNMCSYDVMVYGEVSDVERFHTYLNELDDPIITLWNYVEILSDVCTEKEDKRIGNFRYCGDAKCSFKSSFVENMPEDMSICDIAKRFNVNFEVYSEECGIGFQEYIYVDQSGECSCDCVDWLELLTQDCKTFEEWESKYNNDKYYTQYIKDSPYLTECAKIIVEDNNLVDINTADMSTIADSALKFLFEEAVNNDSFDSYHFCIGGFQNWDFIKYEEFELNK